MSVAFGSPESLVYYQVAPQLGDPVTRRAACFWDRARQRASSVGRIPLLPTGCSTCVCRMVVAVQCVCTFCSSPTLSVTWTIVGKKEDSFHASFLTVTFELSMRIIFIVLFLMLVKKKPYNIKFTILIISKYKVLSGKLFCYCFILLLFNFLCVY